MSLLDVAACIMAPKQDERERQMDIIQIYIDWANHYLEKVHSKRRIQDLQTDVCDGILLCDIVEAVTNRKIAKVNRKPKNPTQMLENVISCLSLLESIGVAIEGVTATDVCEGNLKSILGLFFSLSRYKQKQRREQQQKQSQDSATPVTTASNSKMPSPQNKKRGSGIPTPASLRNSNTSIPSRVGSRPESMTSLSNNGSVTSLLPSMKPAVHPDKGHQRSGLRPPSIVGLSGLTGTNINNNNHPPVSSEYPTKKYSSSTNNARSYNSSSTTSTQRLNKQGIVGSKRTSSSSGFSSARSERSDSSTSISSIPAISPVVVLQNSQMQRSKVSKASSPRTAHKSHKKETTPAPPPEKVTNLPTASVPTVQCQIPQQKPVQVPQTKESSSIPKPMAAIKGTAKAMPEPVNYRSPRPEPKNVAMVCPISVIEKVPEAPPTIKEPPAEEIKNAVATQPPEIVLQPPDNESDDEFIAPIKPLSLIRPRYSFEHHKGFVNMRPGRRNFFFKNNMGIGTPNFAGVGGYMSDGDALNLGNDSDCNDGYMSEGALYLKRTLRDSVGDDSSSVSSEVSDPPLNDLSNDCRQSEMSNGYGQSVSKQHYQLNNQQHVPDVQKHGSRVKLKSSSSQQTDSSSFRQGQQWKKYPLPMDSQGKVITEKPELRRGKSDLCEDSLKKMNKSPIISKSSKSQERTSRSGKEERSRRSSSQQTETVANQQSALGRMSPYTNTRISSGNYMYMPKKSSSSSGSSVGSNTKNNKMTNEEAVPQGSPVLKTNSNTLATSSPRTRQSKVKISGGTQTNNVDAVPLNGEFNHSPSRRGSASSYKSYSLTVQGASKLSANIRERLMLGDTSHHTLPKQSSMDSATTDISAQNPNYGQYYQQQSPSSPRVGTKAPPRFTDGSLSDTAYSTYAELAATSAITNNIYGTRGPTEAGSPYSWLRHSSTYNASISRCNANSLTDSTDSLSSMGSSQHRASLSHARVLFQNRESPQTSRLNRSNSISHIRTFPRSTKSEKLYPSMLQRSEDILHDPYYYTVQGNGAAKGPGVPGSAESQPTSPTQASNRHSGPGRPATMSPYASKAAPAKNDDVNGSSLSLVSTASSLYSTAEEKQANEIRKLRRELIEAQDKVHTLTSQLSTNAHVVSAFEQSLANMTQRLQQMIATSEKKDMELQELRGMIDMLRQSNLDPAMIPNGQIEPEKTSPMHRQLSIDSVSSLSSACSGASSGRRVALNKKKKGWLRSSFSKAFSRNKKDQLGGLSLSDVEDGKIETHGHSEMSAPASPMLFSQKHHSGNTESSNNSEADEDEHPLNGSPSALYNQDLTGTEAVQELQRQLREKDLVLTDIRLEALSSAHQLESLKDTVHKMRTEMLSLKQDNERLQRIVTSKSLTSSQSSLPLQDNNPENFANSENISPTATEFNPAYGDTLGSKVRVTVITGGKHVCGSSTSDLEDEGLTECLIATICVGTKMTWETLDSLIRKAFVEYVCWLDPSSSLGLQAESVYSYHLGEVQRLCGQSDLPDLLPFGYLVGDVSIKVCVKSAQHSGCMDALTFETLIPKAWIQRYINMLSEHRRIIFCGPSGTGKSFLANKLAQFLVQREGREATPEAIASFNVDHKSNKELKQYLANLSEQCENNAASDLPSVIILDNLHNVSSMSDMFNGFLNARFPHSPYIIGTMNQTTCSSTNLQLHHNFRWVLCANHLEPVKGLLARFLKRRLLDVQIKSGNQSSELCNIFDWIPRVWQHLNKFLEMHSSSDVTIGPRLFLLCPVEVAGSQVWFTDLWNYSVVPYLLEAVREGLQLYGRRGPWEDPTRFITQTYPWTNDAVQGGPDALIKLRPEDVGYEMQNSVAQTSSSPPGTAQPNSNSGGEADPLLNMLMRLQEAANYSSPHSNMDLSVDTTNDKTNHRETSVIVLDEHA
ncbi:protein sickie isoform X2 [Neocloeon triangulifer]|uniref:protein sickie isoform X2 n=1 Tax=Neocloeon triangulifer TaxID=2078957 RepID=UPI00286F834E|nr:protein sickie isoform X2 [Neocloeon triangulifer]